MGEDHNLFVKRDGVVFLLQLAPSSITLFTLGFNSLFKIIDVRKGSFIVIAFAICPLKIFGRTWNPIFPSTLNAPCIWVANRS